MALPDIFAQAGTTPKKATPAPAPVSPQPKITTPITTPMDLGGGTKVATPSGNTLYQTTPLTPAATTSSTVPVVKPFDPLTGLTPTPLDKQVTTPKDPITKDDRDAFAQLKAIFESYGLGDLAGTIEKLMTEGYAASQALMMLKYDPKYNQAYTARFKGNADRISKGLNALTEAEYISNENAYAETLRAYGLNNMLSTDRKVNQAKFADYIANDVSSTEFKDRISTAVDNVVNADPAVMDEFKRYYGGLTTSDIVSYFLAPTETLPILKQKATAAGISAESVKQGLGSDAEARAMELSKLGITTDQARVGYGNIGDVLPASQKLSSIYKEAGINYDKTAGESEFLLNNADAQRKRKQLASLERAKFSGDSGVGTTSLNKTSYGKF